MSRIRGTYIGEAGLNSDLAKEGIGSEGDWHDAFGKRMEEAGWSLKHEVVRNDGNERADFLAYHSKLNNTYDTGRWVGFELKYSNSDYESTRAGEIASQIEAKYLDGSWLSSGEKVDLWVVAPYIEESHTGDAEEMRAARHRELEAANLLSRAGFGYLNSWYPTPYIHVRSLGEKVDPFPRIERWATTPAIPAFAGVFDPWSHWNRRHPEAEEASDLCRCRHSGEHAFSHDRNELFNIRSEYRNYGEGGDGGE